MSIWNKLNQDIRRLLDSLIKAVNDFGGVTVTESKYWIRFKINGRAFASLNPSRNKIRVFISCDENAIVDPLGWTRPSPSTGTWYRVHPLVFNISSSDEIEYAVNLLKQAYLNAFRE